MELSSEATTLSDQTADTYDWVSIELLSQALPEVEWKALWHFYGDRAKIRVKPNPLFPGIKYIEGFYR